MSFTCFIVDDHLASAEIIADYASMAGMTLIGIETNAFIALERIKTLLVKPDVVFMDISMPGMTGLDMMEQLKGTTKIIITTGHRQYGPEAYKLDAVHYLLKPITYADFLAGLKRLEKYSATKLDRNYVNDFFSFQGQGKGGIVRVKINTINFLKSAEHYIEIHCEDRVYIIHKSMKDLLSDLGGLPFIRVHKSYAVNMNKVSALKGNLICLASGEKIDLGSSYKADFLKHL